jgi:uncharacterized membrane protein YozB (DUF420 family)
MDINSLPTLNAILNATSGILIVAGFVMIRNKRVSAHRACMIAAVVTSTLFLISYITYHTYHYYHGVGVTRFVGTGASRPIYFTILTTHTFLAVVTVPLVLVTLSRAIKNQFARHMRIARWTFPIWLYVSVTGVVVYLMLYHIYPSH